MGNLQYRSSTAADSTKISLCLNKKKSPVTKTQFSRALEDLQFSKKNEGKVNISFSSEETRASEARSSFHMCPSTSVRIAAHRQSVKWLLLNSPCTDGEDISNLITGYLCTVQELEMTF